MSIDLVKKEEQSTDFDEIINSNDWTKFRNDKFLGVLSAEEFINTTIPQSHNNAPFKDCLKETKTEESHNIKTKLNSQQCDALLDQFGRKIVYDHFKESGLLKTLTLCKGITSSFRTADRCPGIELEFLKGINIGRGIGKLYVKTLPKDSAIEHNIADLLLVSSNMLTLVNYLFAFDYILHNDVRYEKKKIVTTFDMYYGSYIKDLKEKIYGKGNIIWIANKFSRMFLDVIAYGSQSFAEQFSPEDIPNIMVMRELLDDAAKLLENNMELIKTTSPYTIKKLEDYKETKRNR